MGKGWNLAAIAAVFLSGCASPPPDGEHHVDGHLKLAIQGEDAQAERGKLSARNFNHLGPYRHHENRYRGLNASDRSLPNVCLALSGGGLRSGTFSIGILAGLNDAKTADGTTLLSQLDYVSSVSGGSYASTWYYVQMHKRVEAKMDVEAARQDLFSERSIDHLRSGARFLNKVDGVAQGLADIATSPVNWVVNGPFDFQANVAPGRLYYQYIIDKTYHTHPDYPDYSPSLVALGTMVANANAGRSGRLPYPIINTTADIDDDRMHHGALMANGVFELTPAWIGNDWFGYRLNEGGDDSYADVLDAARAASISGAAVDPAGFPNVNPPITVLANMFNITLAYHIRNYGVQTSHILARPWPSYLFDGHTHNPSGRHIKLADGGVAENLGLYSLTRRLCRNIIVVDGEEDGGYAFEAYKKVKRAIKGEMHAALAAPEIDRRERHYWMREVEMNGSRQIRWQPENGHLEPPPPVMEGRIGHFPYRDEDRIVSDVDINVVYLKLAPPRGKLEKLSGMEKVLEHLRSADVKKFPHDPTSDLSYSPEKFDAYFQLGRALAANCIAYSGGKVSRKAECAP